MAKLVSNFRCTECGWTTPKWAGRCGECQQWGTVQDAGQSAGIIRALKATPVVGDGIARPITHARTDAADHWPTGINEFDRVLGGGIVPGSVILLSGEPGVGKSTLLLEVASKAAAAKSRVLYVSAEESVNQVRLRAERTNALQEELYIAAETDLGTILGQIDAIKPDLLIVDSVQTVSSALSEGSAGMPSQVREVASTLIRVAKDRDLPVLLVGHVTKDGSIAGPRVLEHLVDVVCQFEGDRQTSLRFVRALKNRFGPTDEVGCFTMTGEGIEEVPDPSGLFLSRGAEPVYGTCVTITMEGRRAMPVEVQALVTKTSAPNPRRVTSGIDASRVAMLLAVLQERVNMDLSGMDVYVSTVGGIRLTEPAADLAIALAIASAMTSLPIGHEVVAFGEISLAGEIRGTSAAKQRANEAKRLGFGTHVDAASGSIQAAVAYALTTGRDPREAELDEAFL